MFHEQLLRDWGIDSYCGPSLWNGSIPWNIYYLAWYFVNMQGCKYLMGLIIGYHSGYYSSFYMLSCTRYRGSKIEQAFCLIEKSNRSSMIIAYNYFHPMINEYQGADDKAKGMTKSLSLIQLCKLWLITVLIGLISSCVKEPPEICSMGRYWFCSKKYSNFFFAFVYRHD